MKNNTQTETPTVAQPEVVQDYTVPGVSIFETKDAYVLEAEMPGVPREGLEVLLEGSELTLVGHRAPEKVEGQPLLRESYATDYRRTFELDPAIDTSKITAAIQQGLVTVTLPKAERVKPRRITVSE